jgi:hypothetical protein
MLTPTSDTEDGRIGKRHGSPPTHSHRFLFGNPAIRVAAPVGGATEDPWLCVTRFLWFCQYRRINNFFYLRPHYKAISAAVKKKHSIIMSDPKEKHAS